MTKMTSERRWGKVASKWFSMVGAGFSLDCPHFRMGNRL